MLGIPESQARAGYYGAEAELAKAKAENERDPSAAYKQAQTLESIKKSKTPEEIAKLRAETKQALAAGRLSDQRSTEINRLLSEKELAEQLGNSQKIMELNSMLSVLIPNTEGGFDRGWASTADIIKELGATERAKIPKPGDALGREQFELKKLMTGPDIEAVILKKDNSAEALSQYNDFNRLSDAPRAAVSNGKKVKMINLPKLKMADGSTRTLTAREIYIAAESLGMTVEEYLVNVLKHPEAIKHLK